MVVDNLFSVIHATVADLDGIAVKNFSEFVLFREVFVYKGEESLTYRALYYGKIVTQASYYPLQSKNCRALYDNPQWKNSTLDTPQRIFPSHRRTTSCSA